jgi:ABC-type multidrug transport system ATPase subunit
MKIHLDNISKKFNREWVFRNFSFEFSTQYCYCILGNNGSGKSTLLQVIAGNILPTDGQIKYENYGNVISSDDIYKHLSFCAPYLELIEDFTIVEMVKFHRQFKKYLTGFTNNDVIALAEFDEVILNRKIQDYSTGMKQRVKILLAVLSDSPLIMLDEPCTNMDHISIQWFHQLIKIHLNNRLLIISSNKKEEEMILCNNQIMMEDYKK